MLGNKLNPEECGWESKDDNLYLIRTTLPPAPDEIVGLILVPHPNAVAKIVGFPILQCANTVRVCYIYKIQVMNKKAGAQITVNFTNFDGFEDVDDPAILNS